MKHCWILALGVIATIVAATPRADALASHTWVAAEGNDANHGTRLSPFATFAAALRGTSPGGMISVVDPGDYGPCSIASSVTIDGGGSRGSIEFPTQSSTTYTWGIEITSPKANVVLKNLDINGGGVGTFGILATYCRTLKVDNCTIDGCSTTGICITGNPAAENISVSNTKITGGQCGFILGSGYGSSSLTHASLSNCVVSLASGSGIESDGGSLDVNNCSVVQSNFGLIAGFGGVANVSGSTFSGDSAAVCAYVESTIRLSNDSFLDNTTAIYGAGGTTMTVHNNTNLGNTTLGTANASSTPF
jgi:hypothetical protein